MFSMYKKLGHRKFLLQRKDLDATKFIFWIPCVHTHVNVCGMEGAGQECTSSSLGYFRHLIAQKSLKAPTWFAIKGMQTSSFMNDV